MTLYIFKNALRCISRSKGRNFLIGIITLVIAVSACLGLSIRQAAESTKEEALENLSVTATISYDRQSMMSNMVSPGKKTDKQTGERPESDSLSKILFRQAKATTETMHTY